MFDFATYDAFNWFMFLLFVGLPALFCLGVFLRVLWYAFTEKGRETFKRETSAPRNIFSKRWSEEEEREWEREYDKEERRKEKRRERRLKNRREMYEDYYRTGDRRFLYDPDFEG